MIKNELKTFNFKLTDDNSVGFSWEAKLLEEKQSAYQNIKIIEHPQFGKALLLDDYVMFCEYDENKYHELIVYPAIHSLGKCFLHIAKTSLSISIIVIFSTLN